MIWILWCAAFFAWDVYKLIVGFPEPTLFWFVWNCTFATLFAFLGVRAFRIWRHERKYGRPA